MLKSPIEVGDFIGLKTTRIRSLNGEQTIISNADLLKQVVKNYQRMQERRIVFKFGVTCSTTPEQAGAIPEIVRRLVESNDKLRFDRAHFQGFGDSPLDYAVVYIVKEPGCNAYMDAQQTLNLELMRELASLGVDFAFPTRTVCLVPGSEGGAAMGPSAEMMMMTTARPARWPGWRSIHNQLGGCRPSDKPSNRGLLLKHKE